MTPTLVATFLWRHLDRPGHDACRLLGLGDGWRLEGTAVFAEGRRTCCLHYRVLADAAYRTERAEVVGHLGAREVAVRIDAIGAAGSGRWRVDGRSRPEIDGCLDVDLGFTPATNLLPIRRLALRIGEAADAPAAYLSFPVLRFRALPQRYRRTGRHAYAYEAPSFRYAATLAVTRHGAVSDYPGLFELVRQ